MNREFLLNIFFLVFVNLLIKPFFIFGIDLGVQNRVGPAEYGLYFTLLNFTWLFQILNDFGIQNFNNAHLSRHPQLIGKYFPNLLIIKGLAALLYTSITLIFALFWGFKSPKSLEILIWLVANQLLVALLFFLRSNISALGYFRTDSLLSALDRLLAIGFMSVLLWARPFAAPMQIWEFAAAQTFALALTALVAAAVIWPKLPSIRWRIQRPFLIFLLKKSAPFALVVLLMTAVSRLDAVLLEKLLPDGLEQVGIYGNGYRLLDAANMVGFLFATLFLPMFSRLLSQKEDVQPLLSLGFRMMMAGAIPFCTVVFFNNVAISSLLSDHSTPIWGQVLGLEIWIFLPVCINYSFGTLLTANQSLAILSRLFAVGVVINIVLNLIFIPIWKASGAAAASLLTQSLMAIGQVFLAKKELKLTFQSKTIWQFAAFSVLVFGLNFAISTIEFFSFFQKITLGLVGGFLAAIFCKVLNIKKLWRFHA
jgi:O-antigen/teichoic acid export membrane protein